MLTQILWHLEPMTWHLQASAQMEGKRTKTKTFLITLSQEITQMKQVWVAWSIFKLAKSTQSYELL